MSPRARRAVPRLLVGAIVLACLPAHSGECPSKEQILAHVAEVRPERGTRTVRFGAAPPTELYEKAAGAIGRTFVEREGRTVQGVLVTPRSIETMWKALNDEPHHALDGKYVPVRRSEILSGTPRGQSRVLFQYFKKAGVGRWWVSRVEMNPELFRESQGAIWELHWKDILDTVDPSKPPLDAVSRDMPPLEGSYGAWFLVPLGESCTLLEYYNHTEPGGFVSLAQALLAKSSVRGTLDGLVRLADEHLLEPHPDAVFMRPDGTPLD